MKKVPPSERKQLINSGSSKNSNEKHGSNRRRNPQNAACAAVRKGVPVRSSNSNQYIRPTSYLYKFRKRIECMQPLFLHGTEASQFASSFSSNDDDEAMIDFFGTNEGSGVLSALLKSSFNGMDARDSIYKVIVPFISWLSKSNVGHSCRRSLIRRIYGHLTSDVYLRILNGLRRDLRSTITTDVVANALAPVIRLIVHHIRIDFDFLSDVHEVLMKPINEIVGSLQDSDSEIVVIPQIISPLKKQFQDVGPYAGHLHPNGARHDNDFTDFRCIRCLPTMEEVMSPNKPYIPLSVANGGSPFVNNPRDRHLDVCFRGMREDALSPMIRHVQAFLQEDALHNIKSDTMTYVASLTHDTKGILLLYRNILVQLCFDKFSGLFLKVSFTSPLPSSVTKNKREKFWESGHGARMLRKFSLVCVLFGAEGNVDSHSDLSAKVTTAENIRFYQVMGKIESITDVRHSINLKPLSDSDIDIDLIEDATELFFRYDKTNAKKENVMMELRSHFFATTPYILNSLKRLSTDMIPLLGELGIGDDSVLKDEASEYLMDLSPLFRSKSVAGNVEWMVKVGEYDDLVNTIENKRASLVLNDEDISLDQSQVKALASAIIRPVSLIQGPPGTGKTYVGTKIVSTILRNTKFCNEQPILIVTYTNHSLDTFLLDLIASGVSKNDIVRVGSRINPELEECNLFKKSYAEGKLKFIGKSKYHYWKESSLCRENLERDMKVLSKETLPLDEVKLWLQTEHPDLHDGIFLIDEGFTVVGGDHAQLNTWLDNTFKNSKTIPEPLSQRHDDFVPLHQAVIHLNTLRSENLWGIHKSLRKRIWDKIRSEFRVHVQDRLKRHSLEYEKLWREIGEFEKLETAEKFRTAKIIALTTSGAARYRDALCSIQSRVLLVEEAGEVFEAHILASLTRHLRRVILIGDHLQLRPKANEWALSSDSKNGYDIDISLFERLVNENSAKAGGFESAQNAGALVTLHTQRRMRPEIAEITRLTYPVVTDDSSVKLYPNVRGMIHNLWFFDHEDLWPEKSCNSNSSSNSFGFSNPNEAAMIVPLVEYFIRQGYAQSQIVVLTPYVGQFLEIRNQLQSRRIIISINERDEEMLDMENLLKNDLIDALANHSSSKHSSEACSLRDCLRLATVDNFQGEEAEIVIISTVRSNSSGRLGFLKIDNRINVMMSRAKHGMYIFGSMTTLQRYNGDCLFKRTANYMKASNALGPLLELKCKRHGVITVVRNVEDYKMNSGGIADGGCYQKCDIRLPCGHLCPLLCHPDTDRHYASICMEKCKLMNTCGKHPCKRLCGRKCACDETVEVLAKCELHKQDVSCAAYEMHGPPSCNTMVLLDVNPLCGHENQMVLCGQKSRLEKLSLGELKDPKELEQAIGICDRICERLRPNCYHKCQLPCGKCADVSSTLKHSNSDTKLKNIPHTTPCTKPCDRTSLCGHLCSVGSKSNTSVAICHERKDCPPCSLPCCKKCVHSKCDKKCCDPCTPCAEKCEWKGCDHEGIPRMYDCPLPCGVPCARLPCNERCSLQLKCGCRCPGLCGEVCPEGACPKHAKKNRCDVVDIVMFTKLKDYDLDAPDSSPLISLSCGHVFTAETLDGQLNMDDYYIREVSGDWTSPWISLKPLPDMRKIIEDVTQTNSLNCSHCRQPISGVLRYGRVIKASSLYAESIKLVSLSQKLKHDIREKLDNIGHQIDDDKLSVADGKKLLKCLHKLQNDTNHFKKEFAPMKLLLNLAKRSWHDLEVKEPNFPFLENNELDYFQQHEQILVVMSSSISWIKIALLRLQIKLYRHGASEEKKITEAHLSAINMLGIWTKSAKKAKMHKSMVESLQFSFIAYMTLANFLSENLKLTSPTDNREAVLEMCDKLKYYLGLLVDHDEELSSDGVLEYQDIIDKLKRKTTTFHQEVTPDEQKMIARALKMSHFGSYGGHWFTCPNGHVYAIGECGGAVVKSTCPECGSEIGGTNHTLLDSNKPAALNFAVDEDMRPNMPQ